MERTDRDIGEFLAALPEASRDDMETLHAVIADVMEGLPTALYEGTFWGGSQQQIIGYGTYTYTRSDRSDVEWFSVGLAQQKNYISLYISAVEGKEYLSEKYGKELGKVKVGKSSISFARVADIDLAKLRSLLAKARELSPA